MNFGFVNLGQKQKVVFLVTKSMTAWQLENRAFRKGDTCDSVPKAV